MGEGKGTQGDPGTGDKGQAGDASGAPAVIELDGKKYDADGVKELVGQVAAATQNNQIASRLKEVSGKYSVDPTNYLAQAEGALGVISDLIEKGVINEKGEVVQQSNAGRKTGEKAGDHGDLDDLFGAGGDKDKGRASNIDEVVAKALKPIGEQLSRLSDIQAGMIREDYGRRIKQVHPDLDDDDISRVFASYQRDRSTPLMDHAKKLSEKKTSFIKAHDEALAKKWGVNLEDFKDKEEGKSENDIKDAKSGGAGVLFQGKKFSLREKGENIVSPKEASRAYFDAVLD